MANYNHSSLPAVKVVVGVVLDQQDNVLMALRPASKDFPHYWEFPGGKIEPGETSLEALHRELQEEVGITPIDASLVLQYSHDYPTKTVLAEVWQVTTFEGEPWGCEDQEVRWVPLKTIKAFKQLPPDWLPGNERIVEFLKNNTFA